LLAKLQALSYYFISAEVHLLGGLTPNQGRLEVYYANKRGLVCDDGWDINDAKVVCQMLGLPEATHAPSGTFFGEIWNLDRETVMTNVRCHGNESSITDCAFDDRVHYCNTAGVICGNLTGKRYSNQT